MLHCEIEAKMWSRRNNSRRNWSRQNGSRRNRSRRTRMLPMTGISSPFKHQILVLATRQRSSTTPRCFYEYPGRLQLPCFSRYRRTQYLEPKTFMVVWRLVDVRVPFLTRMRLCVTGRPHPHDTGPPKHVLPSCSYTSHPFFENPPQSAVHILIW